MTAPEQDVFAWAATTLRELAEDYEESCGRRHLVEEYHDKADAIEDEVADLREQLATAQSDLRAFVEAANGTENPVVRAYIALRQAAEALGVDLDVEGVDGVVNAITRMTTLSDDSGGWETTWLWDRENDRAFDPALYDHGEIAQVELTSVIREIYIPILWRLKETDEACAESGPVFVSRDEARDWLVAREGASNDPA